MTAVAPIAFKKMCRQLGSDVDLDLALPGATLYSVAFGGLLRSEIDQIATYIDSVLSQNPTPEDMRRFWWSTSAGIVFHSGDDVIVFLRELRRIAGQSGE